MSKSIRNNYLNKVKENSVSIFLSGEPILSNADAHYGFAVNNHFFYLTGINRSKAALLLLNNKGVKSEILFIERNTELLEKWDGARMSVEEASKVSGVEIKNIRFYDEFLETVKKIKLGNKTSDTSQIEDYFFTLDNGDEFRQRKLIKSLQSDFPSIQIRNAFPILCELRMVKNEDEVNTIKEAIDITKEGIELLMKNATSCKTENELEAYYNFTLKKNNVTNSFTTIAASGINATVLHYDDNNDALNKDDLILFDLGVRYNGYCSDISRTMPISGKFSDKQKDLYNLVLESNKETIKIIKPGITWNEINKFARDILIKGMKEMGYIKEDKEIFEYYFHGIGHFLGLDVHDIGLYSKPLEEGNIITIEPGLYIKEDKIGIRIEDDILVTKDGYKNLSENIIKEVKDIEELMTRK